jgi:hypothetical protein
MRKYRRGARFVMDPRQIFRPLDRNAIAKILYLADLLERRTKPKGGRNGVLSQVGLVVLRTLLLSFLNRSDGRCDPSYTTLQGKTGFCRGTIAAALARLERAGVLRITRRLTRMRITDSIRSYITCVQDTNAYAMHEPASEADALPMPEPRRRPFPWRPRPLNQPSIFPREEPTQSLKHLGPALAAWKSFSEKGAKLAT